MFVIEMLKHLDETGALTPGREWHGPITLADVGLPEGIRQLIGRRLERLGLTTRRLLTIGAVIGREFRLSDIEALVDVGEDAVLDAMDEALTASIVTEEAGAPGSFSFTHTLIREALYTSITAARRVRLHHRIAGALEQQSSPSESRVVELAYHFGQAAVYKSADKAVEYAGEPAITPPRRWRSSTRRTGTRWRCGRWISTASQHGCDARRRELPRQTRTQLLRGRAVGQPRRTRSKRQRVCSVPPSTSSALNCSSALQKPPSG